MTVPIPRVEIGDEERRRLPWLDDEQPRSSPTGIKGVGSWIAALLLAVAVASYWAGLRSADPSDSSSSAEISASLPAARDEMAAESPSPVSLPDQEIVARAASEPVERSNTQLAAGEGSFAKRALPRNAEPQPPAGNDRYPLWPSKRIEGAAGRLVRIGNFESSSAARHGWERILAQYPGMARLKPEVVRGTSLRDGREFYTLQVGTSSQAHSDVVCERSNGLALSCSVLGFVLAADPLSPSASSDDPSEGD